jgi:hypothetical protein
LARPLVLRRKSSQNSVLRTAQSCIGPGNVLETSVVLEALRCFSGLYLSSLTDVGPRVVSSVLVDNLCKSDLFKIWQSLLPIAWISQIMSALTYTILRFSCASTSSGLPSVLTALPDPTGIFTECKSRTVGSVR